MPSSLPAHPVEPIAAASSKLLLTTHFWECAKFAEAKDKGEVVGCEVTCKIQGHKESRRCTRTLRFNRHGGVHQTMRKLKWWCLAGYTAVGRKEHRELPFEPEDGLPSLEVLEATRASPELVD